MLVRDTLFWLKVYPRGDCWEWRGAILSTGYGQFYLGLDCSPRLISAHRYAYEAAKGRIPDGLQIDHLCRHRWCVKPSHLEAVTRRENLRRGWGVIGLNVRKTHCKAGHLLGGSNLVPHLLRIGKRICLICHRKLKRELERKYRAARRGAA